MIPDAQDQPPLISVIVRSFNSAETIESSLKALRSQTVKAEILVVDSGSTDATLEIARRYGATIVSLKPGQFTFGRALNIGAATASAPIHAALSSHSVPYDNKWLEHGLAEFKNHEVAAACGSLSKPDSSVLHDTYLQTTQDALEHPEWGFSNTGSFWRAEAWNQEKFDEAIEASEDKEWARRVLAHGWKIAYHPSLIVTGAHRETTVRSAYKRNYAESLVATRDLGADKYTALQLICDWWKGRQYEFKPSMKRRLKPARNASLLGKFFGGRAGSSARQNVEADHISLKNAEAR